MPDTLERLASKQTFLVPLPPSANMLYANSPRGRVKTAEYRAWLDTAGWRMKEQMVQRVPGEFFGILIAAPIDRRRDLDNAIKPVLDLIVMMGIIPDDRRVDDIHALRISRAEGSAGAEEAYVTVRALRGPAGAYLEEP